MNLFAELERLTMPAAGASKARHLSAEEIEGLLTEGQITPLEQIPKYHGCTSEHCSGRHGKARIGGRYGYSA